MKENKLDCDSTDCKKAKQISDYWQNYYEDKLKSKPTVTQIIAFGLSCFALGASWFK